MKIIKDRQLLKKAMIFTLGILPVALVGIYFTVAETFKQLTPEYMDMVIKQLGSKETAITISVIQSALITVFCSFVGYLFSVKTRLMKPFRIEKKALLITLILGAVGGTVIAGDAFTFAKVIPEVALSYESPITPVTFLYSVLYGGIVEEILLRLFFMSAAALIIKALFFRKDDTYSPKIYIAANIISAIIFAAGHLPATVSFFGTLTPLIVFRCFLLNGFGGLIFGYLYRKYGIGYSMFAHGLFHIVSKCILLLFL